MIRCPMHDRPPDPWAVATLASLRRNPAFVPALDRVRAAALDAPSHAARDRAWRSFVKLCDPVPLAKLANDDRYAGRLNGYRDLFAELTRPAQGELF